MLLKKLSKKSNIMNLIKTILVPTDFSIPADYAIHYAIGLAEKMNSSIILYHSFIPFESGFYPRSQSTKENLETEKNLINRLDKIKNGLLETNKQLSVSIHVDRGPESIRLVEFCKKKKIDLIIMGTTGASGLKEVIIGSFTADTMVKAPCPVLAIPNGCKFKIPKKITFASDYNQNDTKAIDFLLKWNEYFNAEMHILHIDNEDHSIESNDTTFINYKQKIKDQFKDFPLSFEHIKGDSVSNTLIETALNDETDILVILPIKHRNCWDNLFHKSITKKTAFHIPIPLLAIPTK